MARLSRPSDEETLRVARKLGFKSFDEALAALARRTSGLRRSIRGFYPDEDPAQVVKRSPSALERIAEKIRKSNRGVTIQGMDNLMIRYFAVLPARPRRQGDRVHHAGARHLDSPDRLSERPQA